ncbi:unnamed protein product, partial [Rotaria sp. Silwood1]
RHDHRRIAIIKLQNYLRGIIVQSKVIIVVFFSPFEISFLLYLLISNVRQIRQHLLHELRNGLKYDQISSFNITNDNYRKALASPRTQIYDYLEGATIADMFDFLSKELLRLQSEQIIHLFVLLADRYRYQREATETACRTKSIERQMLENHALQEMFSLDSNSDIKSYLEDLILESISNTANEQAKLEIKQITETLVNLTDEINNSLSNQSDIEMIVSQLVHQILFPTVQKILSQDKYKNFHMSIKLPSINT